MSNAALATTEHQLDDRTLFSLVTDGDCRKLNDAQKLAYYKARCDAAGLDYRAQPFQFISLNGKLVLYALKACTDQLSAKHGIRCEIISQATEDGIRLVTVRAITADGRETPEIGAVSVKGLSGDALCNAMMKAMTKAKRRAILSVCGLGMLDESEMETIPSAKLEPAPTITMPRRLSERAKPEPVVEAVITSEELPLVEHAPCPEPDCDGDSGHPSPHGNDAEPDPFISEKQRRMLHAAAKENGHDHEAIKRMLGRLGIASSKSITASQFDGILRRLSSAEALEN